AAPGTEKWTAVETAVQATRNVATTTPPPPPAMRVLVCSLWLTALLAQTCGAWVFPTTSPLRPPLLSLSAAAHEKSLPRPAACVTTNAQRRPFSRAVPTSRQRGREGSTPLRAEPQEAEPLATEPVLIEADSASAVEIETADHDMSNEKGVVVTARLHKPVGLMLAETEPGKPGLIVDELIEGGSAEVRRVCAK
ncbi:unnamed protein product, partial [Laminaria digitata]